MQNDICILFSILLLLYFSFLCKALLGVRQMLQKYKLLYYYYYYYFYSTSCLSSPPQLINYKLWSHDLPYQPHGATDWLYDGSLCDGSILPVSALKSTHLREESLQACTLSTRTSLPRWSSNQTWCHMDKQGDGVAVTTQGDSCRWCWPAAADRSLCH